MLKSDSLSDQLLVISERKRCGLILCDRYKALFLGPGAAIGPRLEHEYQQVIEIGTPDLMPATTPHSRQVAISRRIQWMRWLQKITSYPEAVIRAEKLLSGFEAFFDPSTIAAIPDEALAMLVGVLPQTMSSIRPMTPNRVNADLTASPNQTIFLSTSGDSLSPQTGAAVVSQSLLTSKTEADKVEAGAKISKAIPVLAQPLSA